MKQVGNPFVDVMFGAKKTGGDFRSGAGCGYVLMIGFTIVVLLMMNGLLVRAFLMRNSEDTLDIRFAQSLQFIVPLVLIGLEFWIFDWLTRNWRRR